MSRLHVAAALLLVAALTACGDPTMGPAAGPEGEGAEMEADSGRTDQTPMRTPGPLTEVDDAAIDLAIEREGDLVTLLVRVENTGEDALVVSAMGPADRERDGDDLILRFLAFTPYGPVGDEEGTRAAQRSGARAVIVPGGAEVELRDDSVMQDRPARVRVCLELNREGGPIEAERAGEETSLDLWREGEPVLIACSDLVEVP